jgi:hypothetical protein
MKYSAKLLFQTHLKAISWSSFAKVAFESIRSQLPTAGPHFVYLNNVCAMCA